MSSKNPMILVFAGPNGSGKSTITKTFFKRNLLPETYINPDDIAKEITLTSQ